MEDAAKSPKGPLLQIEHLCKSYDSGETFALQDVSFTLERGSFMAIIGSSGAGKSTLLRCIDRLIDPTSGAVLLQGADLAGLKGRELRDARRKISMVFQGYNLVLRSSVIQNVLQGRLGYKRALGAFSRKDKELALEMLQRVGMADYAYVRADQLSGGQKQRVGIARALVQQPALILADEPIASLDPKTSRVVMDLLKSATDELGIACLVSLHQIEYAIEYSDYILGISHGRQCCKGTPAAFTDDVIERVYSEGLLDA